jgi:hypothetical protein
MNPALSETLSQPIPLGASPAQPGSGIGLVSALLLALAVALAPGGSGAAPLITGCCDSLTDTDPYWDGYLPLIQGVYGAGNVHDQAEPARTSGASKLALDLYLNSYDPESVVVLSGTPDLIFARGLFQRHHRRVESMVASRTASR